MKQNKNNDNLQVSVGNKEIGIPDGNLKAYNMEKEVRANLNDDGDDVDGYAFLDAEEMSQEEADALNHLVRDAFEAEVQYFTNKGKHLESVNFSEQYETKMQAALEQYLGKEKAEQLMYERAVRDGKVGAGSAETANDAKAEKQAMPSVWMRLGQWWNGLKMKPAIVCVCVIVVCGIAAMSVDALKTPITRFLFEDEPEYIVLNPESEGTDDESPDTIERKYVPGKVLEGYEEVRREEVSRSILIEYVKSENEKYQFEQMTKDMHTWVDIEDANAKKYDTVFGDAFYYEKDGMYKFVWHYEGYVFKIEGSLTEKEMINLANSLRLEQ